MGVNLQMHAVTCAYVYRYDALKKPIKRLANFVFPLHVFIKKSFCPGNVRGSTCIRVYAQVLMYVYVHIDMGVGDTCVYMLGL